MFKRKIPTYILSIILILATFSSCGKTAANVTYTGPWAGTTLSEVLRSTDTTDMIGGLNYSEGRRLSYLERNRLKIDSVSESDNKTYFYVSASISGLEDTRVQSNINKKISDTVQNWCDLRPVPDDDIIPGITEDMIKDACYGASTAITLSCSDYLSGVIERTIDFYDPETGSHGVLTYDSSVNIDLRSGEEFSMSALFRDGYDYMHTISSAIIRYARDNGMPIKNFRGIPEDTAFSLSEDGLIIYIDDSFHSEGLTSGTKIPVDYTAFGENMVIERSCDDIYRDRTSAGIKLIRSGKGDLNTSEKIYFDEADKLSVKVNYSCPQDFPQQLFADADTFISAYIPDAAAAEKIRAGESDYMRLACDISGYYIGNFRCVLLNCSVKKSGDSPWTAIRSFVYDAEGNEVPSENCFSGEYDLNTSVSGLLANAVNSLMDDGWTIEEEIDVSNIDYSIGSESFSFSTLPVRMSRTVTAADGTEQTEARRDSITASITFAEIGAENLALTDN